MDKEVKKNYAKEKQQEMAEKIIESIEKSIESGDLSAWKKSWKSPNGLPINGVSGKRYNGENAVYLMMEEVVQGYKSNVWLTFKQAKELGGQVIKGSVSMPVFYFNIIDSVEKDKDGTTVMRTNEHTGEMEAKTKKIPILKYSSVFNLDQIEGIELEKINDPYRLERNRENTPQQRIARVEEYIASLKAKTIFDKKDPCYVPGTDIVYMPSIERFSSPEDYYSVFFHELGHWSGAKHRLDRPQSGNMHSEEYAKEELIAELTSLFTMTEFQLEGEGSKHTLDTQENYLAYLQSWVKDLKERPAELRQAASQASKAFAYMYELYEMSKLEIEKEDNSTKRGIDR